jgi:hypothetical protein
MSKPPRAEDLIEPRPSLDDWLPSFDIREHHERLIDGSPEETLRTVLATPVAPDWIVRTLFGLRGLGAGRESIQTFASTGGFLTLERTPTTLVFGLAARLQGRPRRAASRQQWLDWRAPGVKIIGDFRAQAAGPGRTRLTTETRVWMQDRLSHLVFRLYWLVVGPFSALIRRRWLRAISARMPPRSPAAAEAD